MHKGTVYFTKEQTAERPRPKKATEARLRIVREPALHYLNASSQYDAALSVHQILLSADGSPPDIFCETPEECIDKRSMGAGRKRSGAVEAIPLGHVLEGPH